MKLKQTGFTIVELLIVIVVIAILAAISIVAYNGIQNRANDTAIQSDLNGIGKRLTNEGITGSIPITWNEINALSPHLRVTKSAYGNNYTSGTSQYNLLYCHPVAQPNKFALIASSKSGNVYEFVNGQVRKASYSFTGGSGTICSNAGMPIASGNADRHFFYDNTTWQDYVDG